MRTLHRLFAPLLLSACAAAGATDLSARLANLHITFGDGGPGGGGEGVRLTAEELPLMAWASRAGEGGAGTNASFPNPGPAQMHYAYDGIDALARATPGAAGDLTASFLVMGHLQGVQGLLGSYAGYSAFMEIAPHTEVHVSGDFEAAYDLGSSCLAPCDRATIWYSIDATPRDGDIWPFWFNAALDNSMGPLLHDSRSEHVDLSFTTGAQGWSGYFTALVQGYASSVPEPASAWQVLAGLLALALAGRAARR